MTAAHLFEISSVFSKKRGAKAPVTRTRDEELDLCPRWRRQGCTIRLSRGHFIAGGAGDDGFLCTLAHCVKIGCVDVYCAVISLLLLLLEEGRRRRPGLGCVASEL